ncbi:hypothetical protein G3A39_40055 [Paraburkholderia aspalathi]|nr:hypothetical protein [Paraburkholderia aspalathi]
MTAQWKLGKLSTIRTAVGSKIQQLWKDNAGADYSIVIQPLSTVSQKLNFLLNYWIQKQICTTIAFSRPIGDLSPQLRMTGGGLWETDEQILIPDTNRL